MATDRPPPITDNDDQLLDLLERVMDQIVALDLPGLPPSDRHTLASHLTGAVYVTMRNAWGEVFTREQVERIVGLIEEEPRTTDEAIELERRQR